MGKFEQIFDFNFFSLYIKYKKNEVCMSKRYTRKQKDYQ